MNYTELGMDKVAFVTARAAKVASGLADENDYLRAENYELRTKLASFERRDRVRALASQMEIKGLNADLTFDEKLASLEAVQDLDKVADAIKLAGSSGVELASVADQPDASDEPAGMLHSFFVHGGPGVY